MLTTLNKKLSAGLTGILHLLPIERDHDICCDTTFIGYVIPISFKWHVVMSR